MAGGEYQPVGQFPSSEVAGGQVTSRTFLPQGWGEQQGCGGPGPSTPFLSAFCVFQGAILTTMLATRNFSGRCRLRGSSPCLTGCPGQNRRVPGEPALPRVSQRG